MTKRTTHWYPRYTGDYGQKTRHLSMLQHGAFTLLLDHYYNTNQSLPAIDEQLMRICCAFDASERAAMQFVLDNFFTLKDGFYHNKTADEQIAKRKNISRQRSIASSRRGINCSSNDTSNDTSIGDTSTSTPTVNKENITKEVILKKVDTFILPDWIPKDLWDEHQSIRKKLKAQNTPKANSLLVAKLHKLSLDGYEVKELMNEAIEKSWKSFFPPKELSNGRKPIRNDKFTEQDFREGADGFIVV